MTPYSAAFPRSTELLAPFEALAGSAPGLERALLGAEKNRTFHPLPRFVYRGPASPAAEPIKLAIFALLHGDEPAGAHALIDLMTSVVQDPGIIRGVDLFCYPLCNPSGYERAARCNKAGVDLNREFWGDSSQPEVRLLERELRAHRFDGLVALHADEDSPGLYAFARGSVTSEELLAPALAAACAVLPRNTEALIDGFVAEHGVIRDCYRGVLSPPPEQTPAPFEIIFETPGAAPLAEQRQAAHRALRGLIAALPRLTVGGADI